MNERDPMRELLREWQSPKPGAEFDDRVADAYRAEFRIGRRPTPAWRRLLRARISIPVPVLLAAVALIALFLWLRPASVPSAPATAGNPAPAVLTQLNGSGFQPLPNGEARVISVKETR
jgi:hypothetical protein